VTSIFKRAGRKGVTLKYRDAKGRDRFKAFPTRAIAEDHAVTLRAKPDPGQRITLTAYTEKWLTHMESRLRAGPLAGYKLAMRKHVVPTLGHLRLTEVGRGHIKDLMATKLTEGLSRRTASNIHAVLHNCLAEAIEDGYLHANPAASRRGRGLGLTRIERTTNMKAMDGAQLRAFIEAAAKVRPDRVLLFRLLAFTGLRLGEALALRWEDVDQAGKTLRIERGVTRCRVGPPKTPTSIRDVALAPGLLDDLAQLDTASKAAALKSGRKRHPYIFPSRSGGPLHHGRIDQDFKVALAGARLPQHLTPHCLRHTFASLHLQAGESVYWVSRQLGHASIKITVDVYGRWLPPGNLEAAARLEAAVSPTVTIGRGGKVAAVTDLSLEHGDNGAVYTPKRRRKAPG